MAVSSQEMSLTSHQGLSTRDLLVLLGTNPQFRESKCWKDFHVWGTVLHRDAKNKKGLFGLGAAAKATSAHGEDTPAQRFTAAPTKRKRKLWECLT